MLVNNVWRWTNINPAMCQRFYIYNVAVFTGQYRDYSNWKHIVAIKLQNSYKNCNVWK